VPSHINFIGDEKVKARGNTRKLLKMVDEIQGHVSVAKGLAWDDRSTDRMKPLQDELDKAFELCVEITSMYEPV